MTNKKTLPPHERLAQYRRDKGWGLREMGAALNCSAVMAAEFETGRRVPAAYRMRRAAKQLVGIGLDDWPEKESP